MPGRPPRGAFVRRIALDEAEARSDVRAPFDDEVARKVAADVEANDIAHCDASNLKFRDLPVQYAGNRSLAERCRCVINELHLFGREGRHAGGAAISNVVDRSVLRAIRPGDAEGAGQEMRRHIEAARLPHAPGRTGRERRPDRISRPIGPGAALRRAGTPARRGRLGDRRTKYSCPANTHRRSGAAAVGRRRAVTAALRPL